MRTILFTAACSGLLLAISSFLPLASGAQSPEDESFEARVDVIERLILVEIPPGASRSPEDLSVLENEIARDVVAVEATAPGDWRVLVYFDTLRTPPQMIFKGALSLARRADELTELGTVEIVEARGGEAASLGEADEPQRVIDLLARIASEAAENREADLARDREEDLALDRRLAATAESGCAGPPCLLILVSDGYSAESAASGLDGADLGKRLSASGWTVLVLPLIEHDESQPAVPDSTGQKTDPSAELPPVFRVWPWKPRESRGAGLPLSTLDALTEPRWEPLRQWADLTGGFLIRHEREVPELLGRLGNRYLVAYRTPVVDSAEEEPGRVPVTVRSVTRDLTLESPSWLAPPRGPGNRSGGPPDPP